MTGEPANQGDTDEARPAGHTVSLWECLHDAELYAVRSDLLGRTVSLEFDIFHLREHEGLRFVFKLAQVSSLAASSHASWPGELKIPAGVTYEERVRLEAEHYAKGRKESVSWSDFETAMAGEEILFEVHQAEVTSGADSVELRLEGFLDDKKYLYLDLRAKELTVLRSDGVPFNLGMLLKLGEQYWAELARSPPYVEGSA